MRTTQIPSSNTTSFTDIPSDLTPDTDATRDIGTDTTRWNTVYAVIAILASMVIGGTVNLATNPDGFLNVNNSIVVNGSINATQNITGSHLIGNGSQLVSIDWDNIGLNMPSGFADGIDDTGGTPDTSAYWDRENDSLELVNMLVDANISKDIPPLDSPTFTTEVTLPDVVYVGQDLTHTGDTNTKCSFTSDQLNCVTGGSTRTTTNNNGFAISNGVLDMNNNNIVEVKDLNTTNLNVSSDNNTIGSLEHFRFNSTCGGIRYPNGGEILLCDNS